MSLVTLLPQDCSDMRELRQQIDRLDRDLVALLAERAGYIDRAAQIKIECGLPARITDRVEQVVSNLLNHAASAGLSEDLVETLWRELMEWAIAREEAQLRSHNSNGRKA